MNTALATLRDAVLYRLGDQSQTIWTADEVEFHLTSAYDTLARLRVFPDRVYLENLPASFSYTAAFEAAWITINTGRANYTLADERRLLADETLAVGPANYTSVFEATDGWLSSAGASTDVPATAELSTRVAEIERATWDSRAIAALNTRELRLRDHLYETTPGEVYGFTWRQDGVRTFRKVRRPAQQASTHTVTGSWGAMRRCTDVDSATVTGTWGVPRRIPGEHPIGPDYFGLPRRVYRDGTNVRVEHWRLGRELEQGCELPDRYALYLRDYAQARLLERVGPGQDLTLAAHYEQRWQRGLARVERRMQGQERERSGVFGAGTGRRVSNVPRPVLPYNYGSRVR